MNRLLAVSAAAVGSVLMFAAAVLAAGMAFAVALAVMAACNVWLERERSI
jgi:hypothetical protein